MTDGIENCQPKTGVSVENCQPKPVRCGCMGEAKVFTYDALSGEQLYYVNCTKCGICTSSKLTKAEAIEAWNRAMGATDMNVGDKFAKDINVPDKERTAKVEHHGTISYPFHHCGECGREVKEYDDYCSGCGAKLEWE